MKIVLAGTLESISTRSDGSVKVVIATQEMDSTEAAKVFELRNKFLKMVMSDSNITPMDEQLIDELKIKDGKKVKTLSQRQRAAYYVLWEQSGVGGKFESFYETRMEENIQDIKSQLQ